MTDFGATYSEMASEPSDATDPAVVDSSVKPPVESITPAATEPPNPPTGVPVARKSSEVNKAPVRSPKVAATKKPAAKKVSPRKAAKPAITQSSAKKAAATKKAASAKVGVKAAALKKQTSATKTSAKKTPAKKTAAKKVAPLKAKAVKAVVAPPQVSPPTAPSLVPTTSVKAASPESVRDAAKAKAKLVRDSFTMPQQDFGLIAVLKERALGFKRPAKKSELLRAGLHALQRLTDMPIRGQRTHADRRLCSADAGAKQRRLRGARDAAAVGRCRAPYAWGGA